MMTETLEACAETPSPASKRPAEDEESVSASRQYELQATPTPVSKRRCAGLRDKAASAHAVEAAAAEAAAEAASSTARADAAERDAREMQEHARVLAEMAVRLRAAANEAKMKAEEANKKAERAQLESTAEGRKFLRAMSKEQEKADKKLALETARAQKHQEKDEAIATRSAIKSMGDTIKESLLLVKVQECRLWRVRCFDNSCDRRCRLNLRGSKGLRWGGAKNFLNFSDGCNVPAFQQASHNCL